MRGLQERAPVNVGKRVEKQIRTSAQRIALDVKKQELYPTHCFYFSIFIFELHYTNIILI